MSYSRFHLCDLHVHTPADHNHRYGNAGGREPNAGFAKTLIGAYAKAGVSAIAVTDHNRVDWYPVLRDAGRSAGVTVFPGLEFSVNGCHLIGLWDCTDQGYALAQRMLSQLFPPGVSPISDVAPLAVTRAQVLQLADEVAQHQGLVLAPHATAKQNGVFAQGVVSNAQEIAGSELIAAFDVWGSTSADVLKNPRAQFRDGTPRWFVSGDTRALEDVGSRAVYLKMGAEPTLEGIRQAFLAPSTRVRFPAALMPKWGHAKGVKFAADVRPHWPRLLSVAIRGGLHDGLAFEFGPGLNTIIGGKGTGKSALVEILRFVTQAGKPTFEDLTRNLQRNFPANSDATLTFVGSGGDKYELRKSGGSEAPKLLIDGRAANVPVARRLSVTVFGQRELQNLHDRPSDLRKYIAGDIGGEWDDATKEESRLVEALSKLGGDLTAVERRLATLDEKAEQRDDLSERLDRARRAGVDDLLLESASLARADAQIRRALEWPGSVAEAAVELGQLLPHPPVPKQMPQQAALMSELSSLASAVTDARSSLDASITATNAGLSTIERDWAAHFDSSKASIEKALADAGVENPAQYSLWQASVARLEEELASHKETTERAAALHAQREALIDDLGAVRRQLSRLVEDAARQLSERVGPKVRVSIDALGDRDPFRETLEDALKGQAVRGDQLTKLASREPPAVVKAARAGAAAVEALGTTASTASKIATLAPSVLRDIELCPTPDLISVEIDLGGTSAPDWRPITKVSPGQRATALLALALATGKGPLVIDQPEDDLDNRYIFDQVVKLLARVCETRQVIVATHNANIPVLGDAEMVIAFDASSDRARLIAAGGLEMPDVANVARDILEGGDDAFKARQRRYLGATP